MLQRRWPMRAVFILLVLFILFFRLLPLDTVPRKWASPDLITALVLAWVQRRPDYLPVPLLAAILLTVDLLLQRPPGLHAALVLVAAAFLRSRTSGQAEASFAGEWTRAAIVLTIIAVLYRLTLVLAGVNQAPVTLSLVELVLTIAVYPLTVLVTQGLFGVRKPNPGDSDAMGARL
ncbi:MAG: rod shape-determining protein MreD [Marinibacterium sp.]